MCACSIFGIWQWGACWCGSVGGQMGGSDFSLGACSGAPALACQMSRPQRGIEERGDFGGIDACGAPCVRVFWPGYSQWRYDCVTWGPSGHLEENRVPQHPAVLPSGGCAPEAAYSLSRRIRKGPGQRCKLNQPNIFSQSLLLHC